MSYLVLAEFEAVEGREQELYDLLSSMLPGTRSFEGCLSADGYIAPSEPGRVVLIERWRALSDSVAYREWRKSIGSSFAENAKDLMVGRPTSRQLDIVTA
jgi:quinol monooxygenase YgiN